MKPLQTAILNSFARNIFLDHSAVLACILDIPLIIINENEFIAAKHYYPWCKSIFIENSSLSYEKIVRDYNVLFFISSVQPVFHLFSHLLNKKLVYVHFPHGNSDKGYLFDHQKFLKEFDLVLFYGNHMKQRFINQNTWDKENEEYLFIGNLRYEFYRTHKVFYDELVNKEIFSKIDSQKKTLLYAPTWSDTESPTSFYQFLKMVYTRKQLSNYNILIKPHSRIENENPAKYYQETQEARKLDHVLFLEDYPLVFPVLEKVDGFIGDFSSIGYDFIFYRRPMFFIDTIGLDANHPSKRLHQCGINFDMNSEQAIQDLQTYLESWPQEKQELQRDLYYYSFGDPRSLNKLKDEIFEKCYNLWEAKLPYSIDIPSEN